MFTIVRRAMVSLFVTFGLTVQTAVGQSQIPPEILAASEVLTDEQRTVVRDAAQQRVRALLEAKGGR